MKKNMGAMIMAATKGTSYARRVLFTLAAVIAACCMLPASAIAAGGGGHDESGHGGGHGEAAVPYDPTLPRTFEIGDVYIRNFRPTHNEIANIRFTLHVVFKPGASDAVMAELQHWRQRLRDQAITAARCATPEDLADPALVRVQRLMLLRIRRLPLPQQVIDVYLTDFAVGSG